MGEIINVTKSATNYTGIFSMEDYYKLLFDLYKGLGYDIEEDKYSHQTTPTGDSVVIEWSGYKKVDDYSQFKLWAKVEVSNLERVQVQIGGKPFTKNKGTCALVLRAMLVTDYENRWEINPILKFLKGFYDVYFYKSTLDSWRVKITLDLQTIENEIKAFFNMQRFM